MTCNCEFDVDPDDPEDDWHYHRTCDGCGGNWWAVHCPHETIQNPCPTCGKKQEVVGGDLGQIAQTPTERINEVFDNFVPWSSLFNRSKEPSE